MAEAAFAHLEQWVYDPDPVVSLAVFRRSKVCFGNFFVGRICLCFVHSLSEHLSWVVFKSLCKGPQCTDIQFSFSDI